MTKIKTFIHGLYPRSATLVQVSRDVGRKRLPEKALGDQQRKDYKELIRVQSASKLDYIEDGKLTWHDIFRPIVEASKGIETGALTRWFDNNCFYRQPIISGRFEVDVKKLDKVFPKPTDTKRWKVTLPSPYTFARLSEDKTNRNFEKTLELVTEELGKIIDYLDKKGIQLIQINEPALAYFQPPKKDYLLFQKSISTLSKKKGSARLAVHFYFGDGSAAVKSLIGTKNIDIVGVDFYKTNLDDLPKNVPFDIIAGVLDGRNSLLENDKIVGTFLKQVIKKLSPKTLYVSNNSDLELLPEPVAKEKVQILYKLQKTLS